MDKLNILELIDQMYRGEALNYEKYCLIAKAAQDNGTYCNRREIWAVGKEGWPGFTFEERNFKGYYYLGLFVRFFTDGSWVIIYFDARDNDGKPVKLHIYMNGDVVEEDTIEDY